MKEEWREPEYRISLRGWLWLILAGLLLFWEFKTMWTWCRWFTNC